MYTTYDFIKDDCCVGTIIIHNAQLRWDARQDAINEFWNGDYDYIDITNNDIE
jgi:hypothetical protein